MWRYYYLFLFIVLFFSKSHAQQNTHESTDVRQKFELLKTSYEKEYNDSLLSQFPALIYKYQNQLSKTEQGDIYDYTAEAYFKKGLWDSASKFNEALLLTALESKNLLHQIFAKNRKGALLLEKGKIKEAQQILEEALSQATGYVQGHTIADINSNMGTLFLAQGNKEKSLEHFIQAAKIYEKENSEKSMAETYSNMASLYYLSGDIDAAIRIQDQSLTLRKKLNDRNGIVMSSLNIGQLFLLKKDNENALMHLNEAVTVANTLNNKKLQASSYAALSVYHIRNQNLKEAYTLQTKALHLYESLNDKTQLSRMYIAVGGLANATRDSSTAINYFLKGLTLSKEINNADNIANAYDKLSTFYTGKNDYKLAYGYFKNYISIRDSIVQSSNLAKINNLKIQYETEKKDNEINKLNTLQKLKELQIEKQNALLAGNKAEAERKQAQIALLSKSKELQDAKIVQQEDFIKQQELAVYNEQQKLLLSNQALTLSKQEAKIKDNEARIQKLWRNIFLASGLMVLLFSGFLFNRYKLKKELAQKEELLTMRNAISKDLHDEIGSTLTSINILSALSEKTYEKQPQQAKEMLQTISLQSKTVQQSMSDIVWSMRSENETGASLATRIREIVLPITELLNIETTIFFDEETSHMVLPISYKKELLMICKEAVTNTVKHAGATTLSIALKKINNTLQLTIQDNGKWKGSSTGTGTKSMRERAVSLRGNVEITGNDSGTCVKLSLPMP